MRRKTAVKLLMSMGYDRNFANVILDKGHKRGSSNENCVHGTWLNYFKENWYCGDYRLKLKEGMYE